MKSFWLVALTAVAGCGVKTVDPCANVAGTCLTVQVDSSSTVSQVDSLSVQVMGGGLDSAIHSVENGSLSLPAAIGLAIAQLTTSPATLVVTVSGQSNGMTATGSTTAMIASGEHQTVHVQLGASGDMGPACTPTVTSCPATQICGKIPDGCNGFVDCGPCQLLSLLPPVANTGDTLTLEGTFNSDAVVQFPGGVSQAATLLGPHRATVKVPATATNGALTVSTGMSTAGPLAFHRAPFTVGLGPWSPQYPQASYARQMPTLVTARTQQTSVQAGGFVYVIGGLTGSVAHEIGSIERSLVDADGTLSGFTDTGVSLMTARAGHASVVLGGSVYVIGGASASGSFFASIERVPINMDGSLASPVDAGVALGTARRGHAAVVVGNQLYVIGGADGSTGKYLASIEHATINGDGTLGPFADAGVKLSVARSDHAAVVVGNILYVIGGVGAGAIDLDSIEQASINADGTLGAFTKLSLNKLNAARDGISARVLGGSLYVLGGSGVTNVESAAINADGSLAMFANSGVALTTARHSASFELVGNTLHAIGGDNGAPLGSCEQATIDLSSGIGTFTAIPSENLSIGRYYHTAAVIGRYLYVFGGTIGGGFPGTPLGSVERATIQDDGSLSSFADAGTALVTARFQHTTAVAGNHVYVVGGRGSGGFLPSVESATIGPDGSLSAFTAVPGATLMQPRDAHASVILGNYLYAIGGNKGDSGTTDWLSSVERATLNPDGSASAFTNLSTTLPSLRGYETPLVLNGFVYSLGGYTGSLASAEVDRAPFDSTGALTASFANAGFSLSNGGRFGQAGAVVGTSVALIGSYNANDPSIDQASFFSGTLSGFAINSMATLGSMVTYTVTVPVGDFVYALGGATNNGGPLGIVQVANLQ
jgi:N-acetylneuraminic acid mutarotase